MTLTSRLMTFLVATVALVLIGFSVALYMLTYTQLHRELDDHAEAYRGMLFASVEFESNGLEWDPNAEFLKHIPGDELQWAAQDEKGLLGGSDLAKALSSLIPASTFGDKAIDVTLGQSPWRVVAQLVRFPKPELVVASNEPGMIRHRQIHFIVAVPIAPVHEALQTLLLRLLAISTATMLLVTLLARWVGRQALLPLRRMTDATLAIRTDDLRDRLPVPHTQDELHELGSAFNLLLSRVHEAFERQKRFTSEASHQLRTPLTAMLGQVELSLRRNRELEDYKKTLQLVKEQGTRLHEMVEMLLFLARADADSCLPRQAPLDLVGLLPRYVNQFWSHHPRFGDVMVHVPADATLTVSVQADLFEQATGNLIDNAMKYSEPGTPIHLRLTQEGHEAKLAVEDRGPGIHPNDIQHLFSPFFRSSEARQQGIAGIGLGLAIATRIIHAFGGQIVFENNSERGGTFSISLPLISENKSC